MTPRQELESRIIKRELEPSEQEGSVSCIAAEGLVAAFKEYLEDKGIRGGLFKNVAAYEHYKDGEVVFLLSIEEARMEVVSFADHLATQPEANIEDYWGGTLPPLLGESSLDSGSH